MDDPTTRRRRRRQSDQYADDVLRDGEFLRVPMTLADSAMRDVIHQKYPPRGYRHGYVFDQISDPATQGGWPTQVSGIVPMYNNAVGDPCKCRNGKAGTLQPHPTIQSALICVENSKDGLAANDRAYYDMVDSAQNEWRTGKGCCSGCADHRDQEGTVGFVPPPQLPWMTSGQSEGQQCTINGQDGRLVRVNGELVCRPVEDLDHATVAQARRDQAYAQSIRDAENAWRGENWPRF